MNVLNIFDRPGGDLEVMAQEDVIRGLSGKYEDTVNTEAKTSNNIELFLFVSLRTI